tara:strand:- start:120890 stop:121318 length:429 start_codon:yes stop_codon:yes gene_type:complete
LLRGGSGVPFFPVTGAKWSLVLVLLTIETKNNIRMITLSTIFTLMGFEFFYQTSQRAVILRPANWEEWFKSNAQIAKSIGGLLMLIGMLFSIYALGLGAGIFAFVCSLMLVGSLVVLLSPLMWIKTSWLFIGFGLLFILELF